MVSRARCVMRATPSHIWLTTLPPSVSLATASNSARSAPSQTANGYAGYTAALGCLKLEFHLRQWCRFHMCSKQQEMGS